ncbi:MAG TPA: hypothetical protein CFH79_05255 [Sulfurospirillum sp. UBA11407]|nr:MAG TPA: hypothetical protein CFH79_05255 [Sulfurospirillum sp. UBA11407]
MKYFFTNKQIGIDKDKLLSLVGDKRIIFMNQTHSSNVYVVDKNSLDVILDCDAIISNDSTLALCVVVADCNPILFYDAKKHVIGVAHAGRLGTYQSIVIKTIVKMQEVFGCAIEDLHVKIGPSIRKCCYEVGLEVVEGFFTFDKRMVKEFTCTKEGRIYLDLLSLNLEQLKSLHVKENQIEISPVCTCCNEEYFSYRRDKTKNRFCGLITL